MKKCLCCCLSIIEVNTHSHKQDLFPLPTTGRLNAVNEECLLRTATHHSTRGSDHSTASRSNFIASLTVYYFFTRFFCFGVYMIETDIPHLSESNTCSNITFFWNWKLYFSVETWHVLVNLFPCSRCKTFATFSLECQYGCVEECQEYLSKVI